MLLWPCTERPLLSTDWEMHNHRWACLTLKWGSCTQTILASQQGDHTKQILLCFEESITVVWMVNHFDPRECYVISSTQTSSITARPFCLLWLFYHYTMSESHWPSEWVTRVKPDRLNTSWGIISGEGAGLDYLTSRLGARFSSHVQVITDLCCAWECLGWKRTLMSSDCLILSLGDFSVQIM